MCFGVAGQVWTRSYLFCATQRLLGSSHATVLQAAHSIPAKSTNTMWASTSSSTMSASLGPSEDPVRSGEEGELPSSEGAGEGVAEGTSRLCCTWMVKMAWDLLEEAFMRVAATALLLIPRCSSACEQRTLLLRILRNCLHTLYNEQGTTYIPESATVPDVCTDSTLELQIAACVAQRVCYASYSKCLNVHKQAQAYVKLQRACQCSV